MGNIAFTCGDNNVPDYRNDAVLRALNVKGMHECENLEMWVGK